jgi:hypothetical protein
MLLSELYTIAGTVSAIAVLVSVLLLRIQVRQSVKNQRALIQQGRAGRSAEIAMRLMSSDFAEAYHRCMNGETDVTDIQLVQFNGYCRAVFLGAEDSYLQHREALLDEMAFLSFTRSLRALFSAPGLRAMWAIAREGHEAEFVAFMDSIAKETTNRSCLNRIAQWKRAIELEVDLQKAA